MHREPHRFADMEISREERDVTDKLEEQLLHLKRDWDSYKKSSNPLSSRLYSGSSSSSTIEGLQIPDDSPVALMASLQCGASLPPPPPSHLPWKFTGHPYDISAEEVVRDRRAAIESGRLKGCRRLFHAKIDEMRCNLSDVIGSGIEAERRPTAAFSYNSCDSSDNDEAGRQLGGTGADKYNYIIPLDCCSSSAATSSSLSVHDKSVVSAMVEEQRIEHLTTVAEKAAPDHNGKKSRKVTGPGAGLKREFLALAWLIIIIAYAMGRYWRRGSKGQVIPLPTPT